MIFQVVVFSGLLHCTVKVGCYVLEECTACTFWVTDFGWVDSSKILEQTLLQRLETQKWPSNEI